MKEEELGAEVEAFAPEPTLFRAVVDGRILGEYDDHLEMLRNMHHRRAPILFSVGEPPGGDEV